tara:strand:+ start:248 stop:562 length:315 start_codon:yes stop_codon:yes gene_type:complete
MIKTKSKLNYIERKYCSCLVKVRGKSLKKNKIQNPYGICTKSVYSSRKKTMKYRPSCLKNYDFNKLSYAQLKGLIIEKKINNSGRTKIKLINILNKYLKDKNYK